MEAVTVEHRRYSETAAPDPGTIETAIAQAPLQSAILPPIPLAVNQ